MKMMKGSSGRWLRSLCWVVAVVGIAACRKQPAPATPDAPPMPVAEIPAPGGAEPVTPKEQTAGEKGGAGAWVDLAPSGNEQWKPVTGNGEVKWDAASGELRLGRVEGLNGVKWTGKPPTAPFEVELEARRVDGTDFFCGLTVPTRSAEECVTLVVGGWGGQLVGISSVDQFDASESGASCQVEFEQGRWYRIRLKFAGEKLEAWIDDELKVEIETEGKALSLRAGPIEECAPFGLATWDTTGELRKLRWRSLAGK